MTHASKIDAKQFLLLLVLVRVFHLLTFVNGGVKAENAASALLEVPVAALFSFFLLLPAFFLFSRSNGESMVLCAQKAWRPVGWLLGLVLALFFVLLAADTAVNFEFFLTTAVYPQTPPAFFLVTFLGVCLYGAFAGLEPLARVSTFLFFAFLGALFFVAAAILPKGDYLMLRAPLVNGVGSILRQGIVNSLGNFDLLFFLLLLPHLNGDTTKTYAGYAVLMAGVASLLILLVAVGLGDYAPSQTFPFYALTAVAEISIFQRLDSLHLVLWTFIAFLKGALCLYVAGQSAAEVLPCRFGKKAYVLCGALALGAAFFFSARAERGLMLKKALQSGIPIAILAVLVPFALLCVSIGREHKKT